MQHFPVFCVGVLCFLADNCSGSFGNDASNYCGCYACRLACVRCHADLQELSHVKCITKTQKAEFPLVAL